MTDDYDIELTDDYELDISTSLLLDAIAEAEDDTLLLATLAEIYADDFHKFMVECGEFSSEAAQLLEAAELLGVLLPKEHELHFQSPERDAGQTGTLTTRRSTIHPSNLAANLGYPVRNVI